MKLRFNVPNKRNRSQDRSISPRELLKRLLDSLYQERFSISWELPVQEKLHFLIFSVTEFPILAGLKSRERS